TGIIKIPIKVAAPIPPNTVQPIVWRENAPAPVDIIRGIIPKINAKDVIMIGLSRNFTASKVASNSGIPMSTRSLANSTIKIAFLQAKPIIVTNPICAYMLLSNAGMNNNVKIAPNTPSGTDNKIENGTDQLSYSDASNRNTKTIHRAKIITVILPDCFSCNDSPEKSYPYPLGKVCAATSSRARNASPELYPGAAEPLTSMLLKML